MENERLLATITKNKTEEIRVSAGQYCGTDILNLRVYFKTADGEMRPGKQGLACRVESRRAVGGSDQKGGIQMSCLIGIDIGSRGAIALLSNDGLLLAVADMPTLRDGPAGRPTVNAALLADIVRQMSPTTAFIEYVGARPGEGAVGAFAFGRSRGVVEGVLGSQGVVTNWIAAAAWKRAVGIPPGKDGAKDTARSEAIRRWPAHAEKFSRVKDDGRAEAALIGVAGLLREAKGRAA